MKKKIRSHINSLYKVMLRVNMKSVQEKLLLQNNTLIKVAESLKSLKQQKKKKQVKSFLKKEESQKLSLMQSQLQEQENKKTIEAQQQSIIHLEKQLAQKDLQIAQLKTTANKSLMDLDQKEEEFKFKMDQYRIEILAQQKVLEELTKGSGKSSELKKTLKKYITINQSLQMEIQNYQNKLHSLKEDLKEQKGILKNS